ncbi:MAG: hypothetical protein KGL90_09255 [Burkholderiales bacterium]|nr:hypothetical protein [Burkholderiales bacterium]
MAHRFDVCNGDADGLCAALQWRLYEPAPATLLTGMKRDIELLERVQASAGDEVNVFDLSMHRNRAALLNLIQAGVHVRYFDHHEVSDIPSHALLEAHVDCAGNVCTSLLVDRRIGGAFHAWALVGAYGDNLAPIADRLAMDWGFGAQDSAELRRLGEAINYNAYGDDEHDVRIAPARLYAVMARYQDPRDMLAHDSIADEIDAQRRTDLRQALAYPPHWQDGSGSVYVLPDEPWSRRVIGSLANELSNANPKIAHAVLRPHRSGGYVVSVRAPLAMPSGTHGLCRHFGGRGRARAGGIDRLEATDLARFVTAFAATCWGAPDHGGAPSC